MIDPIDPILRRIGSACRLTCTCSVENWCSAPPGVKSKNRSPSIDESSPAEVWNVKEEKEAVEAPEESRPRSLATRMSTFNFSIIRATKTTRSKPSENKKKP
ncbi:unnamed protein product, partial [Durusdinium trenchii]